MYPLRAGLVPEEGEVNPFQTTNKKLIKIHWKSLRLLR